MLESVSSPDGNQGSPPFGRLITTDCLLLAHGPAKGWSAWSGVFRQSRKQSENASLYGHEEHPNVLIGRALVARPALGEGSWLLVDGVMLEVRRPEASEGRRL